MFKAMGVAIILYVIHATIQGEIFAKSGVWGKTVTREEAPVHYWITVVSYAGIGVALLTVF